LLNLLAPGPEFGGMSFQYKALTGPDYAIRLADGIRLKVCPFPGDLALFAIRMLERLGLRPPISSNNLLGIKGLCQVDPLADLARLGLPPLSFQESLQRLMGSPSARTGR
jgi:hypothetical protein